MPRSVPGTWTVLQAASIAKHAVILALRAPEEPGSLEVLIPIRYLKGVSTLATSGRAAR